MNPDNVRVDSYVEYAGTGDVAGRVVDVDGNSVTIESPIHGRRVFSAGDLSPLTDVHSRDTYRAYVDMLARGALRMGESPRTVAQVALVATEQVGDEVALRLSAEPYVENPAIQERLWPKDVIYHSRREVDYVGDLRDTAVEVLKADLYEAMQSIENETV